MRSFRSSADCPAPCYLPFGNNCHDIAGVLAGVKPAAAAMLFERDRKNPNTLLRILIRRALKEGFAVRSCHKACVVVGERANVIELNAIFAAHVSEAFAGGRVSIDQQIAKSTRIGQLLGYSKEATDDFEYGIRHGLNFDQRKLRRQLLKMAS